MPYTLPPLPFPSDALEPHIDKTTMEIHHGKHHNAYVTNLNKAISEGAPNLDGTVQEEKIYHMAGSPTPTSMTTRQIERLIRAAGRKPVERDTLYNVVHHPAAAAH